MEPVAYLQKTGVVQDQRFETWSSYSHPLYGGAHQAMFAAEAAASELDRGENTVTLVKVT